MKKIYLLIHLLIGTIMLSCSELVEIDPPTDSLSGEHLFADDASATSVLNGIYVQLARTGFASGSSGSVTFLAGASADEFTVNPTSVDRNIGQFYGNSLHSESQGVINLWNSLYQTVFYTNTALEGLRAADGLTQPVKQQLQGEALFVRAFCYFYLVNLFGEVPLALTVYNYMPEAAKKKGAPIDWFALQPVVARANAVAIARNARHPNAALLFHDYMLSEDTQRTLAALSYVPANTKVESPLKGMKLELIDPEVTLGGMAKWSKLYNEVIVDQGRK